LQTPGLGLVGAPANAQERVKEYVKASGGFVSDRPVFDAFLEFYRLAANTGIGHVISDKDGVLTKEGDTSRAGDFRMLSRSFGFGCPLVTVLTGSAYEQNVKFAKAYGLDQRLATNPHVMKNPYLLMTENGAVRVNIITGEQDVMALDRELLAVLKGQYQRLVLDKVGRLVDELSFEWSYNHDDQTGKVYVANKKSMVTINVPRKYKDGRSYRETEDAERFRRHVLDIMTETAERMNLPYKIL
jgi:hypothetical protein